MCLGGTILRHAYKYVVKTIYRVFYPIFALLEVPDMVDGQKVVAQRKLLYLEKLFAALLLATPSVRSQLANRVKMLREDLATCNEGTPGVENKRALFSVLSGLSSVLTFYLPVALRLGYLARECTWEGRVPNSSKTARMLLEEVLLVLVHVLDDAAAKTEYVRTVAIALITWLPWHSRLPAVCCMEESCEALLSRMSHRCSANRHLAGFEATFDLFQTLPPPSRAVRATRGSVRGGLVQVYAARLRRLNFGDGQFAYAAHVGTKQMHSIAVARFPPGVTFPSPPTCANLSQLESALYHSVQCLTRKRALGESVRAWMEQNVAKKTTEDMVQYTKSMEKVNRWFHERRSAKRKLSRPQRRPPKPRAKRAKDSNGPPFSPVLCFGHAIATLVTL